MRVDDPMSSSRSDPLMDEVRAIRRELCEQFGNDVNRLCDHLREVEREYREKRSPFAGVSPAAMERVTATWPEEVRNPSDPLREEARELRKRP